MSETTGTIVTMKRGQIPEPVKRAIWAKSAGRCVICAEWLIGSDSYFYSKPVGEIAHAVGATDGDGSPRGESDLTEQERAEESNLMLLCDPCHKQADDASLSDHYTLEFLKASKAAHEKRVRQVTNFSTLTPTAVLRVTGAIRGTFMPATDREIAEALRLANLTAFGEDPRGETVKVELPDAESEAWAWGRGQSKIDEGMSASISQLQRGFADTLSVFAIAPLPLLVYLGSRLDNKFDVQLFGRSRGDGPLAWAWPVEESPLPSFSFEVRGANNVASEATVIVNVSGRVSVETLPTELGRLPIVEMTSTPSGPSVLEGKAGVKAFAAAWRDCLAELERQLPTVTTLHLVLAVPTLAAIEIGRARMRDVHPAFHVYQWSESGYSVALIIS